MNLTIEEIRAAALGVSSVTEKKGKPCFDRFSEAEREMYYNLIPDGKHPFYDRALCSAGVKLCFRTDSPILILSVEVEKYSSRSFFSFDVTANGALVGHLCNFSEQTLAKDYTQTLFPLGKFEKTFLLGAGEKTVSIDFPFSARVEDLKIGLAEGASFAPVKPKKRLLAYGDSITQGYDARYPSRRYSARLADALEAEEINKGIGGEVFRPRLAELSDEKDIDTITVAYGTNDWSSTDGKKFFSDARAFYSALSARYPEAKIFAITPIWRKDLQKETPFGNFLEVRERIAEAVKDLENVTLIDGFDLVPHDENLFADLRLHPRDEGFDFYVENLVRKIKACIEN
jgi:lysophospholipase L1-like esterase